MKKNILIQALRTSMGSLGMLEGARNNAQEQGHDGTAAALGPPCDLIAGMLQIIMQQLEIDPETIPEDPENVVSILDLEDEKITLAILTAWGLARASTKVNYIGIELGGFHNLHLDAINSHMEWHIDQFARDFAKLCGVQRQVERVLGITPLEEE
jgi:hypothetical protein